MGDSDKGGSWGSQGDNWSDLIDLMKANYGKQSNTSDLIMSLMLGQYGDVSEYMDMLTSQGELSSDLSRQSADNSQMLYDMAKSYWDQTAGIRSGVTNVLDNFLAGGYDYTADPRWGYYKDSVEGNYSTGKDQLLASLPSGGYTSDALTQLEGSRISDLGEYGASLTDSLWNNAYGIATGSPTTSFSGLSSGVSGGNSAAYSLASVLSGLGSGYSGLFNSGSNMLNSGTNASGLTNSALGGYTNALSGYNNMLGSSYGYYGNSMSGLGSLMGFGLGYGIGKR